MLEVKVGGKPLDPGAIYRLATNEYMMAGGDGYAALTKGKPIIDASGGPLMANVVMDYITATRLGVAGRGRAASSSRSDGALGRRSLARHARVIIARYTLRRAGARDAPHGTRPRMGFMSTTLTDAEWQRWPAGPYLIENRESGRLLGGTGLAFETSFRAATGYVLARDV